MPTLLSFVRSEAQQQSRVSDVKLMKDSEFLTKWIIEEAKREINGKGGGWFGLGKS
jgi:hypothetical protein